MSSVFRQPFVQFLISGAALFLALSWFGGENELDDQYQIVVDDRALLTYLQFQDKAFDQAQATQILTSLNPEARSRLIEEYVRDEIMVREAISMGLDQNDDVIRQRLVQKIDFIFQGFVDESTEPNQAELQAFFEQNQDRYRAPAQATFTHIFFNVRDRERDAAKAMATGLLSELKSKNAPFEAAGEYGDRFFFLRNYVDRSEKLIEDHFGPEMTEQIFALPPGDTWAGPFSSRYGEHLVLLRNRSAARDLGFEEVARQVAEDFMIEKRNEARVNAYEERAKKYRVNVPGVSAK